jgi:hypothetical protein
MKIIEEACKYAAEQGVPKKEALQRSVEEKPKEFEEKSAKLCHKA